MTNQQSIAGGQFASVATLGGAGGNGGSVSVGLGGDIWTTGINSNAVVVHSVGGGGGYAGASNVIQSASTTSFPVLRLSLALAGGGTGTSSTPTISGNTLSGPMGSVSVTNPGTVTVGTSNAASLGANNGLPGNGGAVQVIIGAGTIVETFGAQSDAVVVQSVGGGGGYATFTDVNSLSPQAIGSMTLGGAGAGGNGGAVTASIAGTVATAGGLSNAVFAQSIGGGGGISRQMMASAAAGTPGSFAVLMGEMASATGGTGGAVTVTNTATILTSGFVSNGLLAQSVGGGGGQSAILQAAETAATALTNAADFVASAQSGTLSGSTADSTSTGNANGNSASSGSSIASGTSESNGSQTNASSGQSLGATLGAASGTMLNGGAVSVTNSGTIQTGYNFQTNVSNALPGDASAAIVAQSIGAGGGLLQSGSINQDLSQSSIAFTLGAKGAASGSGGIVSVTATTTTSTTTGKPISFIETYGQAAPGIVAQSLGGGGGLATVSSETTGLGGSASVALTLGGSGSSAGMGGTVSLGTAVSANSEPVITNGNSSAAVVAQSIGGGGGEATAIIIANNPGQSFTNATGTAGSTLSGTLAGAIASAESGLAVAAQLGSRSTAADTSGGSVGVYQGGAILTAGQNSTGILAQSIGGGGGDANVTIGGSNGSNFIANALLGGASASSGGAVTVTTSGAVTTTGNLATGVLAQTIGSGGGMLGIVFGNVASAGNAAQTITLGTPDTIGNSPNGMLSVTIGQSVSTAGNQSAAVVAQSIGGGGGLVNSLNGATAGSINFANSLALGGAGNGSGGQIMLTVADEVTLNTSSLLSSGVIAQSIGGGGGIVGSVMAGVSSAPNGINGTSTIQLGNTGSTATDGAGSIDMTLGGSAGTVITTAGTGSAALIAQSIGGGGGMAGGFGAIFEAGTSNTNILLGASNSSMPGKSSTVNVNSDGTVHTLSISTQGIDSFGILAQSIGGGGGNVVWTKVDADSTPVTGDTSAIFASTLGQTSPNGSFSGGGEVNIGSSSAPITGSIVTGGFSAVGQLVQSISGGGGAVSITDMLASGGTVSSTMTLGGLTDGAAPNGNVTLYNAASVTTKSLLAPGILVQAIISGGGFDVAGIVGANAPSTATSSITLGTGAGSTGSAGQQGTLMATNSGTIITNSPMSAGLVAQSIGGGGGLAGYYDQTAGSGAGTTAIATDIATLGAAAVASGMNSGGIVTVTNSGTVITGYNLAVGGAHALPGDGAAALVAQSIGAGGGMVADGATAYAINASNITFGLGASTKAGGDGDAVTVATMAVQNASGATVNKLQTDGQAAPGIIAQSIGGGGGSAVLVSHSVSSGGPVSVALTLGGTGESAGYAGNVTIGTSSQPASEPIVTLGNNSAGVVAQSIGGGGGQAIVGVSSQTAGTQTSASAGTASASLAAGTSASATNGLAAAALLGAPSTTSNLVGGKVSVDITAPITTHGLNSAGLLAQSISGGGGDVEITASGTNGANYAGALTLGGNASASAGGQVVVSTGGAITTSGNVSSGIVAQSIGSGGGSVSVVSGGVSGSAGNASQTLALGTSAAVVHNANQSVAVTVNDTITTSGQGSLGIVAQSVGGGGGNVVSWLSPGQNTTNATETVVLGGNGAGSSGAVNLTIANSATIGTAGQLAYGALAQSIGGGGGAVTSFAEGNGAQTSMLAGTFTVGLGRTGGTATDSAGSVTALVGGSASAGVSTSGLGASAVLAQSVGGGGGTYGWVAATTQAGSSTGTFTLGGSGGLGGAGGTVNINTDGTSRQLAITTSGNQAYGLFGQSVGGGGGNLVWSNLSLDKSGDATGNFTVELGQTIANTAAGSGAVSIGTSGAPVQGSVTTSGAGAFGVFAQSISGGGGVVGVSDMMAANGSITSTITLGGVGSTSFTAGAATIFNQAAVTTKGAFAPGVFAQSVGGGGGVAIVANGGNNSPASTIATVALGANAAVGSNGGPVTITNSAAVITNGAMSFGVAAQSVGGGGGIAGYGENGSTVLSGTVANSNVMGATGTAGSAGNGGLVTIGLTGAGVTTGGVGAVGILAQSVGGGGGIGFSQSSGTNSVQFGGTSSGNGAAVSVTSSAPIMTSGQNAIGILAQSVGGGGGLLLNPGSGAVTASTVTGTGNGGNVTVAVNSDITTSGAGAYGVVAQSVGGGGGLVQSGTGVSSYKGGGSGTAGTVAVTVAAGTSITASGAGAVAIYTYSNADPQVEIGQGASVMGGSGGAAVLFDSPNNVLINQGTIVTLDGASGLGVLATGANTTIQNSGMIQGNMRLAPGANIVQNLAGGTILAGSSLDLGASGILLNSGTIARAAADPGITQINGSLVQAATGLLQVRTSGAGRMADSYLITGTAQLAGIVQPVLVNPGKVVPGAVLQQILTASGGISYTGPLVVQAQPSAIMSYSLTNANGTLGMTTIADFSPAGLSASDARVGQAIGMIQSNGSSPLMEMLVGNLVAQPDVRSLAAAYRGVSGDGIASVPQVTYESVSRSIGTFADRIDNWMVEGLDGGSPQYVSLGLAPNSGTSSPYRLWANPFGGSIYNGGMSDRMFGGSMGLDRHSDDKQLFGGIGITATQSYYKDASPTLSGSATNVGISGYGVARFGAAYLSGVGYVGAGHSSYTRSLQDIGINLATNSMQFPNTTAAVRVEAGYGFQVASNLNVAPFMALQPTQIWQGGTSENFSSYGNGLSYRSASIQAMPMLLGVKLDGLFGLEEGESFTSFARLAWMHDFSPSRNVDRSFAELPGFYLGASNMFEVTDAAILRLGGKYRVTEQLSAIATFDTGVAKDYRSFGASLGLLLSW